VFFAMGTPYLLKGLAAVILGGLGSIPGAVVGGVVIGVSEAMTVGYLEASWREGITFGILMLVLIARPEGILGKRGTRAQVL
jgi:branched-subunit amino acid ABC-type transport system permease component